MIYAGAPMASRIDDGTRYRVRSWFRWPDGTRGEDETVAGSYADCDRWLALAGAGAPLTVTDPDTGRECHVAVLRARIEAA